MVIPRATVVGDGGMGTLCALLLARGGCRVILWGAFPDHIHQLETERENRQFLPGHRLPESIRLASEPASSFDDPTVIISAVPCQFTRGVWRRFEHCAPRNVPIVSVTKGIENDTLMLPTAIIRDCLGEVPTACLSGPSIAPEVASEKPASVVVASSEQDIAQLTQTGMSTEYFRIYTSTDVLGVELAGAVKNVVALAAGICDGIEGGDNAKAALVTRGLVEITRLGLAMGASADTFRGLAGVGDLITTCISKVSRNRSAGERIGRGASTKEAIAATSAVIEGIPTTRSVLALAEQYDVEMPIVSGMAQVLFEGRQPQEIIRALMTRPLREESVW
jgi:glycerol-3-phosphate dehydrogenase (NAD(P)+)